MFEAKVESDRNFERLTKRLIAAKPLVRPAIASHNVRSIAHALAHAEDRGTSSSRSCAASATTCSRRSPAWICAFARIAPSETSWPA